MNKKIIIVVVLLLFATSVVGCGSRRGTGAAVGGVAGGVLGATTGRWVLGAVLGSALGYVIGNEWTKYDERRLEKSFESGNRTRWSNPETGQSYTADADTYYRNGRRYRDVTIVDSNGRSRKATLVETPNGRWEVVD